MARIASGPQASASSAKSSRFSSRSSGAASITRSQPARSASSSAAADAAAGAPRPPPRSSARARRPSPAPRRSRSAPASSASGTGSWRRGLVAAERGDLGDPGAHRAGADDADPRSTAHSALELRLALLEEGLHPLDPVLGRHRQLVEPPLALEPGARAPSPRRRAPPAWRAGRRSAAARRRSAPARSPRSASRRFFDDLVDEAPAASAICGVEAAAGQHVLHRPLLAERPGPGAGCRRRRG